MMGDAARPGHVPRRGCRDHDRRLLRHRTPFGIRSSTRRRFSSAESAAESSTRCGTSHGSHRSLIRRACSHETVSGRQGDTPGPGLQPAPLHLFVRADTLHPGERGVRRTVVQGHEHAEAPDLGDGSGEEVAGGEGGEERPQFGVLGGGRGQVDAAAIEIRGGDDGGDPRPGLGLRALSGEVPAQIQRPDLSPRTFREAVQFDLQASGPRHPDHGPGQRIPHPQPAGQPVNAHPQPAVACAPDAPRAPCRPHRPPAHRRPGR